MRSVALDGAEVRTLKNNNTGDSLAVIAARGMVFSSWRFSPEELLMVQAGKPVWVVMRGELVPEFTLAVGDRNQVVPPEIIKRAQMQDAVLKSPEAVELKAKNKREGLIVEAVAWGYAILIGFICLGTAHTIWRIARG